MTLSCGVLFSVTETSTRITCPVDRDDIVPLTREHWKCIHLVSSYSNREVLSLYANQPMKVLSLYANQPMKVLSLYANQPMKVLSLYANQPMKVLSLYANQPMKVLSLYANQPMKVLSLYANQPMKVSAHFKVLLMRKYWKRIQIVCRHYNWVFPSSDERYSFLKLFH